MRRWCAGDRVLMSPELLADAKATFRPDLYDAALGAARRCRPGSRPTASARSPVRHSIPTTSPLISASGKSAGVNPPLQFCALHKSLALPRANAVSRAIGAPDRPQPVCCATLDITGIIRISRRLARSLKRRWSSASGEERQGPTTDRQATPLSWGRRFCGRASGLRLFLCRQGENGRRRQVQPVIRAPKGRRPEMTIEAGKETRHR